MDIKYIKENDLIIYECVSGSKAYGLELPTSDTDIKGVFILPKEKYYGWEYMPQISDETNDTVYYEVGRFIELLCKNNPTIIELINTPSDKVLIEKPIFKKIKEFNYLSKKCKDSFAGYAMQQVKKAKGLNKKIHNPLPKERKNILEFCLVLEKQGSKPLLEWLKENNLIQEKCGLVNIPKMKDIYGLYYGDSYKGIMQKETANTVALSSVSKGESALTYMYFNKDGYAAYCKEYKQYWDWVALRNEERYKNTLAHAKNYDAKNMMHTFRLLDMAIEILRDKKVIVKRDNREELLSIRKGEFEYEELMSQIERKINTIHEFVKNTTLQDEPNVVEADKILFEIRNTLYND